MLVVADTNTVVSGLLWHGAPRQVLDAAHAGTLDLYTNALLLAELADVLQRPKFAQRLTLADVTPQTLVVSYAALARLIVPATIGLEVFGLRLPLADELIKVTLAGAKSSQGGDLGAMILSHIGDR